MRSRLMLSPDTSGLMRIAVAEIPGGKTASIPDWKTTFCKTVGSTPAPVMNETLKEIHFVMACFMFFKKSRVKNYIVSSL